MNRRTTAAGTLLAATLSLALPSSPAMAFSCEDLGDLNLTMKLATENPNYYNKLLLFCLSTGYKGSLPMEDDDRGRRTPRDSANWSENQPFRPKPLQDFHVTAPASYTTARVCIRDHECEDGDAVALKINGRTIIRSEITNQAQCRDIELNPGRNAIQLLALNGTGHKGRCSYADSNTGEISVRPLAGTAFQSQTWQHRGGRGSSANIVVHIR